MQSLEIGRFHGPHFYARDIEQCHPALPQRLRRHIHGKVTNRLLLRQHLEYSLRLATAATSQFDDKRGAPMLADLFRVRCDQAKVRTSKTIFG